MSNPFVGEIRMFGGNFAPSGWALCNGQLMPIAENDTLFTLIGTTFGGDGQETFGLPDLQGRLPIHAGQGPQLPTNRTLGEMGGSEVVTLTVNQIPIHKHVWATNASATTRDPQGNLPAHAAKRFYATPANLVTLPMASSSGGGSQPHDNMHPFLSINFIISLFGIFPHT